MNEGTNEYQGSIQPTPGEHYQGRPIFPYLASEELRNAVNLAIHLQRPLLLQGEPGSGKTKLAIAVAYELGLDFEAWYVKSTSHARDGLYIYDTVGRLRDAQLAASGSLAEEAQRRFNDPTSYIQWGPLGRAFLNERPTVVLIDEIDKADIDFPNDLLLELDEKRIKVEEVKIDGMELEIDAVSSPIVFITSNQEKDLPDAFLRRCLFYYIPFPDEAQIAQIVAARFPELAQELIDVAVARFLELRNLMTSESSRADKNVSTSELLDWVQVLQRDSSDEALRKLEANPLPYLEVLLKSWEAHVGYLRLLERRV